MPVTIAAFGDSLTAGYRLPAESAFPARLQSLFHADGHTGVQILNFGISGDTTRGGLSRIGKVLASEPDIVILELGANDLLSQNSPATAKSHLSTIITRLEEAGARVILTGVEAPAILAMGNPHIAEYRRLFDELAETHDVTYYPNFLDNVHGKRDLNLDDGLHPNAKGIEVIAQEIYPLVKDEVLAVAASRK